MRDILEEIGMEVIRAIGMRARQLSAHEWYAVILEELEEFWDEVEKKRADRSTSKMRTELIQCAAMCVRAITDIGL